MWPIIIPSSHILEMVGSSRQSINKRIQTMFSASTSASSSEETSTGQTIHRWSSGCFPGIWGRSRPTCTPRVSFEWRGPIRRYASSSCTWAKAVTRSCLASKARTRWPITGSACWERWESRSYRLSCTKTLSRSEISLTIRQPILIKLT